MKGLLHDAHAGRCKRGFACFARGGSPVGKSSYHSSASRGKMLAFATDLCRREAAEWVMKMLGRKKNDAELARLREENEALRRQLESQSLLYRQWENLLQYDGSPQKSGKGGEET